MSITIIAACSRGTVYSEFRHLPLNGWPADSVLTYKVNITDTVAHYDLVLNVRHGQNYPYQNIWFFVENGLSGQTDTLEYYLADQRGRWLGNGYGDRHDMPCLMLRNAQFPHAGTYIFKVRHGMRDEILLGIGEMGLTVEKQ